MLKKVMAPGKPVLIHGREQCMTKTTMWLYCGIAARTKGERCYVYMPTFQQGNPYHMGSKL